MTNSTAIGINSRNRMPPLRLHDRRWRIMYQFPATKFVKNNLARQWWHLLTEVLELGLDLWRGRLQHAAAEAWDVKHSAETLHRILAGRGADVKMAREQVLSNNLERGYYS